MKTKAHSLPSFSAWLNKGFELRAHARGMQDSRINPEISPGSVFLALFHAFVFRLPSLQQLEKELHHSYLRQWIGAERAFDDDTLRYSLCGFELEPLEALLVDLNRRLKRGKAFDQGRVQGRLVAALDGIEVLASYSRRCEHCLQRRVMSKDAAGREIEQTQYYHRAVGCQLVHSPVKAFLGLEWLRPGEGEDTAALRLLRRLPQLYGSRFFDILLLDALYAQTPLLELVQDIGWDVIISLKQSNRDLYQSAMGLFASRQPDAVVTERQGHKLYQARLWDAAGLPFTLDNPEPVRVVRSEERLEQNHYRQGERRACASEQQWLWVTTLPRSLFAAATIRQLGHSRWKQENNGWMDLTRHWSGKHGFLHACRHRPRRADAAGQRRAVDNRGLAAVLLVLLIAFNLSMAFVLRHSKLARRYELPAITVAAQLRAWISQAPPRIRGPD